MPGPYLREKNRSEKYFAHVRDFRVKVIKMCSKTSLLRKKVVIQIEFKYYIGTISNVLGSEKPQVSFMHPGILFLKGNFFRAYGAENYKVLI